MSGFLPHHSKIINANFMSNITTMLDSILSNLCSINPYITLAAIKLRDEAILEYTYFLERYDDSSGKRIENEREYLLGIRTVYYKNFTNFDGCLLCSYIKNSLFYKNVFYNVTSLVSTTLDNVKLIKNTFIKIDALNTFENCNEYWFIALKNIIFKNSVSITDNELWYVLENGEIFSKEELVLQCIPN